MTHLGSASEIRALSALYNRVALESSGRSYPCNSRLPRSVIAWVAFGGWQCTNLYQSRCNPCLYIQRIVLPARNYGLCHTEGRRTWHTIVNVSISATLTFCSIGILGSCVHCSRQDPYLVRMARNDSIVLSIGSVLKTPVGKRVEGSERSIKSLVVIRGPGHGCRFPG